MDQQDQRFLHYVNVSAGSTNCYVYYLLRFQSKPISMDLNGLSRLSVFSTNCCTRPFVFLERGMLMHVLVVFRWHLSAGSTNCSSYSLLCFQNEECLRLCISRFIAGIYRSVRVYGVSIGLFVMRQMTGTFSQTALGTFPIFQFLDVLLETCSLFYRCYPFYPFLNQLYLYFLFYSYVRFMQGLTENHTL